VAGVAVGSPFASAAAGEGDEAGLMQKLLEVGHEPDGHGLPPVHVAAAFGEAEVLRSLLLKGADKDSLDGFGCSFILDMLRQSRRRL